MKHYFLRHLSHHLLLAVLLFVGAMPASLAQSYTVRENVEKGKAEMEKGFFEEALSYFNRALMIDSRSEEALFERGRAFWWMKKYDDALYDFQMALDIDPNRIDSYILMGTIYYEKKNYTDAIDKYNKALALSPNYALAYNYRAECHKEMGLLNDALDDYNQAIRFEPNMAVLYFGRGQCNLELHNYEAAESDFSQAMQLAPDQAHYLEERISARFLKQDFVGTIEDLQGLKESFPALFETFHYGLLATSHGMLQNYPQAVEAVSVIIEKTPQEASYYAERASYFKLMNQPDNALQDYLSIVALEPDNIMYLEAIGEMYAAQENLEQTLVYAQKIVDLQPENAQAHYWIGWVFLRQGNPKTAKPVLVKAAQLGYPKEKMEASAQKLAKKGFSK
ncbi:MAG TPA: hypothetical protein DCM08_13605 [Microscillaceae bacterium]|nr:hypothetical protein [Microscillaceae bacterium]